MNQGFFLHIITLFLTNYFILSVCKFSFKFSFKFYLSYLRKQCLGFQDVLICIYVNNYVEFVFLLLRGPYVRLVYLLNMLSSLNKDIIIIIRIA